jgi:hypothetical protein
VVGGRGNGGKSCGSEGVEDGGGGREGEVVGECPRWKYSRAILPEGGANYFTRWERIPFNSSVEMTKVLLS